MSAAHGDAGDRDDPPEGYAWSFARQERDLPSGEYRAHMHLLDEIDEDEIGSLDLSGDGDYVLWAAVQALEELERDAEAIALLQRIATSTSFHPALDYSGIALHLAERLKERGDYDEALAALRRAATLDPGRTSECDERRAEILVLRGRPGEGLALFEEIADEFPGDPWVPLRAGWALLSAGTFGEVQRWVERSERALAQVADEDEGRDAASEIDRLRVEARSRLERRASRRAPGAAGLKDEILAALDAEEALLTANPPRTAEARARAAGRLAALHARASRGWDDAVEARDESLISEFDEVQGDVAGLASRFGIVLPGTG